MLHYSHHNRETQSHSTHVQSFCDHAISWFHTVFLLPLDRRLTTTASNIVTNIIATTAEPRRPFASKKQTLETATDNPKLYVQYS